MNEQVAQKITAAHLNRDAYLYVRQSTLRQVFENTESTRRQYALRERAVALGWPVERIHVIDADLGKSGASSVEREGFRSLVAEVSMGRAGIVMGLEVSRLARNSTDWHRLLEICALTDTLILDEDGIYSPAQFNDRLLLGLKGTMSDAELHVLRARLRGGILNRARRGELKLPLPVGLVYDATEHVVLDPDSQVRQSVMHLFETFERTGSASATVRHFDDQQLSFPRRLRRGARKGELIWGPLRHSQVLRVLHNPRYAGAFVFGRTRTQQRPGERIEIKRLAREDWLVLIEQAHPGYLSWEQYERNVARLRENAQAHGGDRRQSPPREGAALLQGLVVCGVCGRRMTVRYHTRQGQQLPEYVCQRAGIEAAQKKCQSIPGHGLDKAIGAMLIDSVTPVTLEVALAVHAELQARADEAKALRQKRVERARYEADLARSRFMQADPDNRLVVDVLEAEWNEKLRALHDAQQQFEQRQGDEHQALGEDAQAQIRALAGDFPRLWNAPQTAQRERKRMLRLVIDDVTLIKGAQLEVGVRFRGGATQTVKLPLAQSAWQLRQTSSEVVSEIDTLLDEHTEGQIATILNERGLRSGEGKPFHPRLVQRLRRAYGLTTRFDRLRQRGLLTLEEMAQLLGVAAGAVKSWRNAGMLRAYPYNDKNEYLYEHPGEAPPVKQQGRKLAERRRFQ